MTVAPPKKPSFLTALLKWAEAPTTRKEVAAVVAAVTAIVGGLKGAGLV